MFTGRIQSLTLNNYTQCQQGYCQHLSQKHRSLYRCLVPDRNVDDVVVKLVVVSVVGEICAVGRELD